MMNCILTDPIEQPDGDCWLFTCAECGAKRLVARHSDRYLLPCDAEQKQAIEPDPPGDERKSTKPITATEKPAVTRQAKPARPPCLHLGELLRLVECHSCCGKVRVKVFACSIHGETTVSQPVQSLPTCSTCQQFEME
jgi:hypothetical protein